MSICRIVYVSLILTFAACAGDEAKGENDPAGVDTLILPVATATSVEPDVESKLIVTPTETKAPSPSPFPIPTQIQAPATLSEIIADSVDLSICQQEDQQGEGEVYVAPNVGVRKRNLPHLDSEYSGVAGQNTKLVIECERDVTGSRWFKVKDPTSESGFWVLEAFTSLSLMSQPTVQQPISPPVQTTPLAAVEESPTPEPSFPWTRDEVLFGPNTGFEKARNGETLTVWIDPALDGLVVDTIISPWNSLAGWSLFSIAANKDTADVLYLSSTDTWVKPDPDYGSSYTRCTVFFSQQKHRDEYQSQATNEEALRRLINLIAQHELGHCLGLVDFVSAGIDTTNYVNPQSCDGSKLYSGVMSYCDWLNEQEWFGGDDRKLLETAGYTQ